MRQRFLVLAAVGMASFLAFAGLASAQEIDVGAEADALLVDVVRAKTLCATDRESIACKVADLRAIAIVANAVAEAGRTKDRATFLDIVRALLTDGNPEIRTSAVFALANLRPDATDTQVLLSLARDPISDVRGGAWAAAALSSDPKARLLAKRVAERPTGTGYLPDPQAFDPKQLGFELPEGADYLWLTLAKRGTGELDFLTDSPPADSLAFFAPLSVAPARPLLALIQSDPAIFGALSEFLDTQVFGEPVALSIEDPSGTLPRRLVVVYHDRAFDRTGFAVVFSDGRDLRPQSTSPADPVLQPERQLDDAALDAAMLKRAGFKPTADPDESGLFMAIVAASGFGAEDYLELYPDGAYAVEAGAYVKGPRMMLDQLSYSEISDITLQFENVPPETSASVEIQAVADGYSRVASTYSQDVTTGDTVVETNGNLRAGVQIVVAEVRPGDGSGNYVLTRDFSVVGALATLSLDKSEYAPGETISITYSGMLGDRYDYVSTAEAGAPNTRYLTYIYTDGAQQGTTALVAPTAPGTYELRAFYKDDETILRGSVTFTVASTAAVSPTPTPVPKSDPSDEPNAGARATLALDESEYAPGQTMTVTFSGMSGDTKDFVAIASAGSPNTAYLQYVNTNRALEGTATLLAPGKPGSYEVRAFYRENETMQRVSLSFTVTGAAAPPLTPTLNSEPSPGARATLALDKKTYAPGETITITYSGMFGDRYDYICTAEAGAPNTRYHSYKYTDGAQRGTITLVAPTAPGAYELRAFYKEDETILRGSVAFVVE